MVKCYAVAVALLVSLLMATSPFVLIQTVKASSLGPLAAFTYNPCVMCASVGDPVFFNANWSISPNAAISSYTWDFGDSTPPVTTSNPSTTHVYLQNLASATWKVTLTVQDSTGQTDVVVQTVIFEIHPAFTLQPPQPGVGQQVAFNASSTQIFSSAANLQGFQWSFGDGTTGSGKLTVHSYQAAGMYRIALAVQTTQGSADASETLTVGQSAPPPPPASVILRSLFGIAFYNSSGRIIIELASLFLNMTVKGTNSTGTIFNINSGRITIGPSPTISIQRNFTATSGQAFQSNNGRLTITAVMAEVYSCQQQQPPCLVPNVLYQLYLTGPSRLVVSTGNSIMFFTRLFGFLYNSQARIGLFFVVGISPGDVDEDGRVDIGDLAIVASSFGTNTVQSSMTAPSCSSTGYSSAFYADADGDGRVDIQDLEVVAAAFGQTY